MAKIIRYVSLDNGKVVAVSNKGYRTFSKLKLFAQLKTRGLWATVKAYLEEHDLWDAFVLAQIVDEQNSEFAAGLKALQTALGMTDDQVEEILDQCETDEQE